MSEIETRISEAEAALHKLMIGESEVEIADEDGKVRYAQADQHKLETYIAQLKARRIGTPRRGALGVTF